MATTIAYDRSEVARLAGGHERAEEAQPQSPRDFERDRSRLPFPRGKRLALHVIRNQIGDAMGPAGPVAELTNHWAPEFARRDAAPHVRDSWMRHAASSYREFQPVDREDLHEAMRRPRRNAPGPDELP